MNLPPHGRPPAAAVDVLAFVLFFAAAGWGVYELFLPHPSWTLPVPLTLRSSREPPDPRVLQARVRQTPPVAAQAEWRPAQLSSRWRWIVLHHSATEAGSAARFDENHQHKRGMENGLGYHFVIRYGLCS